jgi:tRNA dimethylallyltransferase
MQSKLVTILGPTSTGKTSLALELCKNLKGVIVSADSRQIYKHMDIGTGKLPINSKANIIKNNNHWIFDEVPIWGYDLATPDINFRAYDYAYFAINKINELVDQEVPHIFLVGGTGFYIDIILNKIKLEGVEPNNDFRQSLEQCSLEELQNKVKAIPEINLNNSDFHNKHRLIRTLEKVKGVRLGAPLPKINITNSKTIGLFDSRQRLYEKVDSWLDFVWKNGLITEVTKLRDMGYKESPKLKGLVYKSAVAFIEGEDEKKAIQQAKYALHAYIRRQQTWFKKNDGVDWLQMNKKDIATYITDLLE